MIHRPQKYANRDPFPNLPFYDDQISDGLPTLSEAVAWFMAVAFLTVVICLVMA